MKKNNKTTNENEPIKFYTEELKKNKSINEDTVKIISFIVILIVVIGLFVLLYFVNGKYVTKDMNEKTTTTAVTTEPIYDSTKVTVDTMFNISKDTYYVLAYDSNDEVNGSYIYSVSRSYSNDKIKLYTLDLANAQNKNYYNKKGTANTKPSKASDVTFTTNTLIVFKKGKVAEFIQDKDKIIETLRKK